MASPRVHPLVKKLARDLSAHRAPTLTILLILTLGIGCLTSFRGVHRDLTLARDRYYQEHRFAHFEVSLRRAPLRALEVVRSIPGVAQLEARIDKLSVLELDGVEKRLSARVLTLPDYGPAQVNRPYLREGHELGIDGEVEAWISADFAKARKLSPGDSIWLLAEDRRTSVRIAGIAESPEFIFIVPVGGGIVPEPENFAVLWLRRRVAAGLYGLEGAFNNLVGRVGRGSHPEAMAKVMQRRLDAFGVQRSTPRKDQQSHAILRDELSNLRVNSRFMPSLFLIASALVLHLFLGRLITSQRVILGTLKALGTPRTWILGHYISFALVLGTLGALAGSVLGVWLAGKLGVIYLDFYHLPHLETRLHLDLLVSGLAVSWGTSLLGVWGPAQRILELNPSEAMRPAPPEATIPRWLPQGKGLPFLWRISLRNLLRHPFRALVSLVGIALGAALMVCSRSFSDAMIRLSTFRFQVIQRQDQELFLLDGCSDRTVHELERIPGVLRVEGSFAQPFDLRHGRYSRKLWIVGLDPEATLRRPKTQAGSPVPIPAQGLLLAEKLAEVLRVRPGQSIEIQLLLGETRSFRVPVRATYPSYLGLDAFANRDWLRTLVGHPQGITQAHVALAPPEARFERQLTRAPRVLKSTRRRQKIQGFEDTIKGSMDVATWVLIFFAGALACGMNLNGALVSAEERRRELATLWVQGFSRREISDLMLYEQIVVAGFGILVGVPLGLWFAWMGNRAFSGELYRLPWVLSRENFAVALLASICFAGLAHGALRLWVRQQDLAKDLQVKE